MPKHREKLWSVPHYNAVAKEIRELFPLPEDGDDEKIDGLAKFAARRILATLAISFATRFYQDYIDAEEGLEFDPVKFLNQCSPDTHLFPLGTMWEDRKV